MLLSVIFDIDFNVFFASAIKTNCSIIRMYELTHWEVHRISSPYCLEQLFMNGDEFSCLRQNLHVNLGLNGVVYVVVFYIQMLERLGNN